MFQRVINREPAPAAPGDFASNNPRSSVIPPVEAGFVAAVGEAITVGYFAWGAATGLVYSALANAGATPQIGFVASQPNRPSVLITAFLGEAKMTVNDGMPVTLLNSGDYWAYLPGATVNAPVYAVEATGAPSLVDDGTTIATGFFCVSAAPVNAVTAATTTIAAATGIMTVATVASGVLEVGQRVTGTGVPAETYITKQLTGGAGGAGTYQTNSLNRAAVAAFTATMTQGGLVKISRVAA